MSLKALVKTAGLPDEEPEVEEIPLPPRELWAELDNSGQATVEKVAPVAAPAVQQADQPKAEVAKLDFSAGRSEVIGLDYPFTWEGREITEVTVRRLTVGEVNTLLDRVATEKIRTMDIFAIMCGLPAAVLRGLDDDDGRRVMEVANRFLPRVLRTDES